MTKHQPRVHTNSPVRSSPRPWVPDGTGAPSAFPRASHPAITRGARRGRGQVTEHGPEPTLYVIDLASNPALITRYVRPRVALAIRAVSTRPLLRASSRCAYAQPRALAIARTVDDAGDCFDRRDLAERMIPSATNHVSVPVAAARARRHDLDHPSRVVAFAPARRRARMPYPPARPGRAR
jgi:hypothetical protein